MARKKIREHDSKRLLREHIKRLAGLDLPLKTVQVRERKRERERERELENEEGSGRGRRMQGGSIGAVDPSRRSKKETFGAFCSATLASSSFGDSFQAR